MFTEELALKVGIAYGIYVAQCKSSCSPAISAADFKELCCKCIEEIRDAAGLIDENSVTG